MQITISRTDLKAVVGYLEAYAATVKQEPRSPTLRELNQARRATLLRRKLEKKLSLSE